MPTRPAADGHLTGIHFCSTGIQQLLIAGILLWLKVPRHFVSFG
jgi:hypothetical protein